MRVSCFLSTSRLPRGEPVSRTVSSAPRRVPTHSFLRQRLLLAALVQGDQCSWGPLEPRGKKRDSTCGVVQASGK